jgi:glycosyltransferase involved in cell wall biosynthesis
MRALRIAEVAPLWTRVPPKSYGGAELMVSLLTEALVQAGHDVTLYASGDSRTAARLRPISALSVIETMERGEAYEYEHYANAALAEAIRDNLDYDVIHCHLGGPRIPIGAASRVPVVHTLHIPLALDDQWALRRYPATPVVAISKYQAADIPVGCTSIRVIPHGIDFAAYEFSSAPAGYLLFLARMGPQKSPVDAIHAAKAAGLPLLLAGQPQNAEEESYFREKVVPLIDGRDVRHVGVVEHKAKVQLLKGAAALLFPIRGPEAFGLAMIEAMACGTPVLGFRTASVPEIVDDGITGYTATETQDLAGKAKAACALDRARVRAHAEARFSHLRMAEDYIALFQQLAGAA